MIKIQNGTRVPKYKQIIASIEESILLGALQKGDPIPSINEVKNQHKLSRDTVLMAFNDLKNRGVIKSVVGKGYYVASENIKVAQKIFLLFDELNAFKEDLYNSFLENLGGDSQVDIFFHHFNKTIFSKLIHDSIGNYSYYVIMPANLKDTLHDIQNLPDDRVYILDQMHRELQQYPSVYQNFNEAIYGNLTEVLHRINTYDSLILVFNEKKQPEGMRDGFLRFCVENGLNYKVVGSLKGLSLKKGELYIMPDDRSLLTLIKKVKELNLVLGGDVGAISYNDTLLKEIVEGGITTISTDFKAMGRRLAQMIMDKERVQIENPHSLILRNSL